uniref:CHR901 n=1 Tax=Arundo donax TaxID=35708 RepID=A0A0A9DQD0_ARUDO
MQNLYLDWMRLLLRFKGLEDL